MKNNKKYYYFGELGFFNIEILGALSHFFQMFPDIKIDVITFKDYADILDLLFKNNINTTIYSGQFINAPNNRSGHRSYLDRFYEKENIKNLMMISKSRYINKYSIDQFSAGKYCSVFVQPRIFYLKTPIIYNIPNLPTDDIVCICPRYRSHFSGKNILSKEWDQIFQQIKNNNSSANIVALGKKEEMLSLDYNGIIYPSNIYEHIHYINHCNYGVFPDSGMAEFALNCNCKLVKVIYKKQFYTTFNRAGQPKPLLHGFNPFNSVIQKIESIGDLL